MNINLKNILNIYGYRVNKNSKIIYSVLYSSIKKAIINRALNENTQLPPTRVLSGDLNIARSTVLKAYELLIVDKYIYSIQGSGYYVAPIKDKKIHHNLPITSKKKGFYPKLSLRGKSFMNNGQISLNVESKKIAFRPGLPPLDTFPVQKWKNLSNAYWRSVKSSELTYSDCLGLDNLKKSIAEYLKLSRNITCKSEQIIITTGSLHALSLVGDVLIDPQDEVVIENPTYPNGFSLFKSLRANIYATNIDQEGIQVKQIKAKNPKLIYTTPSNQYPTGVKMSIKRRRELLSWSADKNCLIIEDDYDHEFSNWEKPISPLFSLDKQDSVIYLSTFNKLLHPSIRIGYMIVPTYLIKPISSLYEQSTRFVSPSLQNILSEFINRDYLNKHIRNIIKISLERKEIFITHFNQYFENLITLDSNNTGLHIIGLLPNHINDIELSIHFHEYGISVHPYSKYFVNKNKQQGLVMGYCSVNNKLIKDHVLTMYKAYRIFAQNK